MAFCNNSSCNSIFAHHISRFIGDTVTIFTTSGGISGCGFTGVVLSVNHKFVRLMTHMGEPPATPLAENICGDLNNGCVPGTQGLSMSGNTSGMLGGIHKKEKKNRVGSICDIPIDRIAAFCHNAV